MRTRLVVPIIGVFLLAGCAVSPFNALNDDQRRELRDNSSDYQQEVLADLTVEESEYRQSVDDWRQCVVEAGAQPSEIAANGNELGFDITVESDTVAHVEEINHKTDSCRTEYNDAIGRVWVSQGTELN